MSSLNETGRMLHSVSDFVFCDKPNHWSTTFSSALVAPHVPGEPYYYMFQYECSSLLVTRRPNMGMVICKENDAGEVVWIENGQTDSEQPPKCTPNIYIATLFGVSVFLLLMFIISLALCCRYKRRLDRNSERVKRLSQFIGNNDIEPRYQPQISGTMPQRNGRARSNSLPMPSLGNVIPRSPTNPLPPIPQETDNFRMSVLSTGTYYGVDSDSDSDPDRLSSIGIPMAQAPTPSSQVTGSQRGAAATSVKRRRTFKNQSDRISKAVKRTLSRYVPKMVRSQRQAATTDSVYVAPQASFLTEDQRQSVEDEDEMADIRLGEVNSGFNPNWKMSRSSQAESQRASSSSNQVGERVSGEPAAFGAPSASRVSNIPPLPRSTGTRGDSDSD